MTGCDTIQNQIPHFKSIGHVLLVAIMGNTYLIPKVERLLG